MKAKSKSTAVKRARNKYRPTEPGSGGETVGAGCRIVGEERVHKVFGFTPRRSSGERGRLAVYSMQEGGCSTLSGNPAIRSWSRRGSVSSAGQRSSD